MDQANTQDLFPEQFFDTLLHGITGYCKPPNCIPYRCIIHTTLQVILNPPIAEHTINFKPSECIATDVLKKMQDFESPPTKGGHPQLKSSPPQLRNIADNQIDCEVAD
jgi:hypothetical protein